jgi:hypothetical protein
MIQIKLRKLPKSEVFEARVMRNGVCSTSVQCYAIDAIKDAMATAGVLDGEYVNLEISALNLKEIWK